ncbi:MAG: amino acid ABC transporter permease, partial [Rhizobiaceae bacterium]
MYKFDFAPVFASFGHLLAGAAVTMELSCGAMLIGLAISVVCAAAKTSRIAPLVWIVNVYVEVIRNT